MFPEDKEELDSLDPLQDVFENKNLIFQGLLLSAILKLAKMPGGMKTIQVLGKATIDGLFKSLSFLGQASACNYISAWANPVLISSVLERFSMLPPRFNRGYHAGITMIAGVQLSEDVLGTVLKAIPFLGGILGGEKGGGKEANFPESVNFASPEGLALSMLPQLMAAKL